MKREQLETSQLHSKLPDGALFRYLNWFDVHANMKKCQEGAFLNA